MNIILLGNIICFTGSVIMVLTGFVKTKKKILLTQCAQFTIMSAGNFVLGGISGGIADAICVIRNLISLKWEFTLPLKIIFIGIQIALTAVFNDAGIIGWLPVIAACIFTWCLDSKNEILLKALIILAQIMWGIYDISIHNYATLCFDVATCITNLAGIIMILKNKKNNAVDKEVVPENNNL